MSSQQLPAKPAPSFSMEDFEKALEQQEYSFQVGQTVKGIVHSLESNGAYIDIGAKSLAFLPAAEATLDPMADLSTLLPVGSEQEFLITREQDADGQMTVSRRQLELQQVWQQIQALQADHKTVAVRVTGVNKGGVIAVLKGVRGFIPRSHLTERDTLEQLTGQTLTVSFLEVDPDRNKLVFSQRLAARAASISQLEIGQLISGKITGIKPFGVFVEFDGTTGLLHINQVSHSFVKSLEAVFQVGQAVKAVIIDRDGQKGRISLSTKVLESSPGEMVDGRMEQVMAEAEIRAERLRQKSEI